MCSFYAIPMSWVLLTLGRGVAVWVGTQLLMASTGTVALVIFWGIGVLFRTSRG